MSRSPGIKRLTIKNYRVLRDVTFKDLAPLTVLFGPNGSGKSTVFDVFAFLNEAFTTNLRRAWDARNRIDQIRSRGLTGPVTIELQYREAPNDALITYRIELDEERGRPVVRRERLRWSNPRPGRPPYIIDFTDGTGKVLDEASGEYSWEELASPDLLAVSTLGQLSRHPRVTALRRFISGWYLSYISTDQTRSTPDAGPAERLSQSGDNLPNVVQYLQEQHPDRLEDIFTALRSRVPRLEKLVAQPLADGRLLLGLKDQPFDEPILSRWTSDGTLKLLAYLTVLYDPDPPTIIGVEEPENQLHPRLLQSLVEEARGAAERSQLIVTTHSPFIADALTLDELWLLYRGEDGFAKTVQAKNVEQVRVMKESGGLLGDLWMEGFFGVGDPLASEPA